MSLKRKLVKLVPDKVYIKHRYKRIMGKPLNLKEPQTFNEKLQWLKLYDRRPIYTTIVDKYEVKKYVANIIGPEYVIPTIGVWNRYEEIDFDDLPDSFVLKCTHDSGGVVICKDKSTFDYNKASQVLCSSLRHNFYWDNREWPYKNVTPRIIAEQYVEDESDRELRDYKFYCFDGKPYSLLLATDRQNKESELHFDYFDMDFNHLKLTNHWHPNAKQTPHKPKKFDEMKVLAEKLAEGFPEVRVDFYEANGSVYFGEMTLFDMGGCLIIHPDGWDYEWGNRITLPIQNTTRGGID